MLSCGKLPGTGGNQANAFSGLQDGWFRGDAPDGKSSQAFFAGMGKCFQISGERSGSQFLLPGGKFYRDFEYFFKQIGLVPCGPEFQFVIRLCC